MFDHLHFGGGAYSTLSYPGVMACLERDFPYESRTCTLSGTSAGAIFAFLFLIGCTSKKIIQEILETTRTKQFLTFLQLRLDDYDGTGNIGHCEDLILYLKEICHKYNIELTETLTFADLYTIIPRLFSVTATSITSAELEFFDVDTTPHMSVLHALRMTTCIPMLMIPIEYNGQLYIDGMIGDMPQYINNRFPSSLIISCHHKHDTIKQMNDVFSIRDDICHNPILLWSLLSIITCETMFRLRNKYNTSIDNTRWIRLSVDNIMMIPNDMLLEPGHVYNMFIKGYEQCQLFLKKHK